MSGRETAARDNRVLFLAPTSRDASMTQALLVQTGIRIELCRGFETLVREMREGAAAILLPEETLTSPHSGTLREVLAEQPPWSDLPVLVLTRPGADSPDLREAARTLGNVTLLERPLRVATLLSAVQTALRARARQYQTRGHLAERARTEEALRTADQRKDEFIATLSHELRNPLAPLLMGLQLLRMADIQDPRVAEVLAVMERQTGHLIRLVDDLLELSRITRGVIDVQREPVELEPILNSAVETVRAAIDAARHELTVEIPAEPITISGDAVRLTQVFANILANAVKYTNPGGRIGLSVWTDGGRAVISVRDNGRGIPPARLASVFDMFTQVDRSDRRTQGGLGIGLTLARSLVQMHGGSVEARSPGLGGGSEFVVTLPILGARPPANAVRDAAPGRLPPRRILVVDDNTDAAATLGDVLAALGADVSVAQNGRAALERLDAFAPDAVLLDIGMPDMDGYEVARRIRATPGYAEVLIIALTGWGQEHDRRRSSAAGIDHHLVKPPDMERLTTLLRSSWPENGHRAASDQR